MIYLHQLTTEWFPHFARVLFSRNYAYAKFSEIKTLLKFPTFTVSTNEQQHVISNNVTFWQV